MTLFPFSITEICGRTVVTLPVEVDIRNAALIRDRLLGLLNTGAGPLVIDMTETQFCDCAGLTAILRVDQCAAGLNSQVCVVLPAEGPARRVATLTGLSSRTLVAASLTSAHRTLATLEISETPAPSVEL
jgi:anti-anti-sigma factor